MRRMSEPVTLAHLAERLERLLLRHQELQRTNALLQQQLDAVGAERDALKSRLSAARHRIDALLQRVNGNTEVGTTHPHEAA